MSAIIGTSNILAVQKICGIIVCKLCKLGLPSERSAKSHLCDEHRFSSVMAKHLSEKAETAAKEARAQGHPLRNVYLHAPNSVPGSDCSDLQDNFYPPLDGIKTTTGFKCTLCRACYSSERGMRSHILEKHHTLAVSADEEWLKCEENGQILIQTLFGGIKTRYYAVSASTPLGVVQTASTSSRANNGCPNDSHLAIIPRDEASALDACENITISERHMQDNFNEMDGVFCRGVEDGDVPESHMNAFIARTKFDTQLCEMNISLENAARYSGLQGERSEDEKLLVRDVCDYLLNVPTLVPDISPAVLQDINLRGDKEFTVVSKRSAERYARSFARFVISAMRVKDLKFLPDEALQPLAAYIRALSTPSQDQQDRMHLLHKVLKALCLHGLHKMDSPRSLFVRYFIIFSTVMTKTHNQTDSFRFAQASDISPMLAALLYGVSSCAITEVYRLGSESGLLCKNSTFTESQTRQFRNDLQDRLEAVLCALEESQNSAASFIRKTLSIAVTISRREDVDFVFDICERHSLCGIVNNVHIEMSHLGNIVKDLHKDIDSSFSCLLYGASLPSGFFSHLSAFEDSIHNKASGFSFLSHGPNKQRCRKYAIWLFNQITEDRSAGKAEFSPEGSTAAEVLEIFGKKVRREAVQRWLSKVQKVQDMLLVCSHISSGSPGRATELETLQLFNSNYALRNVYICQQRIMLVTRYSKTRTLAGGDRIIPRFPDIETSKRFLTYLVLFRTLESIFVKALYGIPAMKTHMKALFVERGKSYVACRIRDEIRGVFRANKLSIEFNHFRHFAAGMVPIIVRNSPRLLQDELITEASTIAHLQANHSPRVAEQVYARKPSDIPSLPTTALAKYRMFSIEWHRSMGLLPDSGKSKTDRENKELSPNILEAISEPLINSVSRQVSQNIKVQLGKMSSHISNKKRCEPPTLHTGVSHKQMWNRLRSPPDRNSEKDVSTFLPSLRLLLRNPNAMFRSEMQLQVNAAVCEGRDDLMVLMPTGSGKTISVLLPVFLEGSQCCTVIIVPLAALVHEYVEKCCTLGISVATWSNREEHVQVYVMSIDHNLSQLQSFLRSLENQGRLKRLVLDEVHLLLLWLHFRPSLRRLPYVLNARGHYVQVVLLTATLPPLHRDRVLRLLSLSSVILFAQPTVRPNLRFEVIPAPTLRGNGRYSSPEESMTMVLSEKLSIMSKDMLQNGGGRILVFALYQREVERLCPLLQNYLDEFLNYHFPLRHYHGGMNQEDQNDTFKFWKANDSKLKIVVCTSAFGTGLDVPDVRAVFHFGGSNGLLEYAQETGRAGRDGKPAQCTIIYNKQYCEQHSEKVNRTNDPVSLSNVEELEEKKEEWIMMEQYMSQSTLCRKNQIYSHSDGNGPGMCIFDDISVNCDICDGYERSQIMPTNAPEAVQGVLLQDTPVFDSPHPLPFQESPLPFLLTPLPSQTPPSVLRQVVLPPNPALQAGIRTPLPVRRRLSFGNSSEADEGNPSILDIFRSIMHSHQNLCVACLVLTGNQELLEHRCKHMRNRCKRCFHIGHQVNTCETFEPRRKNYCYGCSLSQIKGENIHKPGEFGKKCFMGMARDLAWMVWAKDKTSQDHVAEHLFRDIEMTKLQQCQRTEDNHERNEFFDSWLRTEWDGVPNLVRFVLWWDKKN